MPRRAPKLNATAAELNTVGATLKACIREYHTWNDEYSQEGLWSLRNDVPDYTSTEDAYESGAYWNDDHGGSDQSSGSAGFQWLDYEHDDLTPNELGRGMTAVQVDAGDFLPHPSYEACTPTGRNVMVGDDSDHMPFAPFADDESFDFRTYSDDYDYLAWQTSRRDPDIELISMEITRRLVMEASFKPDDIDRIGLFALNPKSEGLSTVPRLAKLSQMRDFPEPLPSGWVPKLPYTPHYSTARPSEILDSLVGSFCHNPNCLTGYCTVHLGKIPLPVPRVPVPGTLESLSSNAQAPCGKFCFISPRSPDDSNARLNWTSSNLELLHTILSQEPGSPPCDLAIICRRPCFEVYRQQMAYLEKMKLSKDRGASRRTNKTNAMIFEDYDANDFKPKKPCSHTGPCDGQSKCKCFRNNAHCTPNCRCDIKCARQWKGCNCAAKNGKKCDAKRCPCVLALRECDARVCGGCTTSSSMDTKGDVQGDHGTPRGTCRNMAIQLGLTKATEVRRSRYGLGLYILESSEVGDLVIEYTGELVFENTVETRDHIARQNGRAYVFQLNSKFSVDSTNAGNEARFINHDPIHYNCHANIVMVNGEHRIGFFASKDINKGSELLLNYGPEFFRDASPGQLPSTSGGVNISLATPKRKGHAIGAKPPN